MSIIKSNILLLILIITH